jgi:hypothetical protein
MKAADLVQRLSKAIESAVRSHHFCVSGALTNIDPRFDVAGLGPVKLPLKPAMAKRLMAECVQAPYGKGTETLVNVKVRNAFELAPDPNCFAIASSYLVLWFWQFVVQDAQQVLRARACSGCLDEVAFSDEAPSERLRDGFLKLLLWHPVGSNI